MKIQKIAKLCKRQSTIEVVDLVLPGEIVQFVGNGSALYALYGMPRISEDNAFGLFDIPKDKKKVFSTARFSAAELGYSFQDNPEGDTAVFRSPILLGFNGGSYEVLRTDAGFRVIESVYLEPVADGPFTLWLRHTRTGGVRIIVKDADFQLVAIIEPSRIPDDVIDAMGEIVGISTPSMFTDPDTGEIIQHDEEATEE